MKRPERSVIFLSIIAILAGIVLASCGGGGAQGNSENGDQGSQGERGAERGENGEMGRVARNWVSGSPSLSTAARS